MNKRLLAITTALLVILVSSFGWAQGIASDDIELKLIDSGTGGALSRFINYRRAQNMLADGSNAVSSAEFNIKGITLSDRVRAAFASITSDLEVAGVSKFSDGTAAAPSITFGSDPDTGIYRFAGNQIGFAGLGRNIASLYRGNLNLTNETGTTGAIQIFRLNGANATGTVITYGSIYAYADAATEGAETGRLVFRTRIAGTDAERMTISQAGNILIGTTTDDGVNKLQVNGSMRLIGGSAPGSPTEGSIYYNSTDKKFYGWNGTAWKQLDN